MPPDGRSDVDGPKSKERNGGGPAALGASISKASFQTSIGSGLCVRAARSFSVQGVHPWFKGFQARRFRAFRASKHFNTIYMDQHVNKASNTASRAPFISIHHCTSMAVNPINDLQELILRGDRRLRMTAAPFLHHPTMQVFQQCYYRLQGFWLSHIMAFRLSFADRSAEAFSDRKARTTRRRRVLLSAPTT